MVVLLFGKEIGACILILVALALLLKSVLQNKISAIV